MPIRISHPIKRIRQTLSSHATMQREISRCYIYSETDPITGSRNIEAHARSAVENGFVVQRGR